MIIGVDLGNYAVKTSENLHFLSKVIESNGFYGEKEICFEGKKIIVGEGEFQTDFNKSLKENTLPLLFSALALSHPCEECFEVVLGLPIQQYKNNKQELIDYIKENRCKQIIHKGHTRNITICDVTVAPEGASVYYNLPKDIRHKIDTKQLVIVDIGGRTTDVCLFKNKQIKKYKTIPSGILNVYSDVVNVVNEEYTTNLPLEDAEEIIEKELFINGVARDRGFIKQILKLHFDSIFKELQLNFDISQGYVLLTGGGSNIFKKAFNNRLNNLIISSDCIFDNVKGFKKIGEKLWR